MPWESEQVIKHVEDLGLPKAGVEYVREALAAPSRLVGRSSYLAVSSRFASGKLGQVVQAESHTCELPFVHSLELDDGVITFLDQPPPLPVESMDRRGRRRRAMKTPDFLVVGTTEVTLYECKTRGELERLVAEQSCNWIQSDEEYRYLPAEGPAAALGIQFRIHDAGVIGQIYAANLRVLVNVKRNSIQPLDGRAYRRALRLLFRANGLPLRQLADELQLGDVTQIFASILHKHLHALLRWQLLTSPESAMVYGTAEDLRIAETALKSDAELDCLRQENYQAPLALSKSALRKAIESLRRIALIRSGELRPTRSDYRRMRALREGEKQGIIPLLAVAPAYHRRGARNTLPKDVEEIIRQQIHSKYELALRWTVTALHRSISSEMTEKGHISVCYETVRQRVKALPRAVLVEAREGHRAANAVMPPTSMSTRALRDQYAWAKAHVDSTIVDLNVWLSCALGDVMARPTIYLLIDESTSFNLAYWVCFDSAGDEAVACLFRDCIRRHEKLPSAIMHDQGSEYFSIYAETFTAATGIDLHRRPTSAGRYGSHVESAINRLNKELIHKLPGNTQNDRLGRAATARVRSEAHVRQQVVAFLELLEDVFIGFLNDKPVNTGTSTPRKNFEESEKMFAGLAKKVCKNPDVLANTAIPSRKGRRINHVRGIKYQNRYYEGPQILDPSLDRKIVPIRWEPYNPNIIYAQVRNEWVRLTCRGYHETENVSIKFRTAEFHIRSNAFQISKEARQLADRAMAERVNRELIDPERPKLVREARSESPEADLFKQARSRNFEKDLDGGE